MALCRRSAQIPIAAMLRKNPTIEAILMMDDDDLGGAHALISALFSVVCRSASPGVGGSALRRRMEVRAEASGAMARCTSASFFQSIA